MSPEIIDGICDCPDICKNKKCQFYNITKEATRKYMRMVAEEAAHPWRKKHPRQKPPKDCPLVKFPEVIE